MNDNILAYCSAMAQARRMLSLRLITKEEYGKITVYMPKFKFSYEKYLNKQLQSMGMIDAFNPYLADLSGIVDASIYVSFVKQNTFVEVDEKGTEAAAVTIAVAQEKAMISPDPITISFDSPFLFLIRDTNTGAILFIGQLLQP